MVEVAEEEAGEEGEEAGGYVVEHDAGAVGEGFEFADGPGLEDVEEAEEEEGEERRAASWAATRMRAKSWPATSSMTTKPGSLRADSRAMMVEAGMPMSGDEDGGDGGGDGEGEACGGEEVCGGVPEEDGGDAAVGAGAGLEVACAEEGGEGPGPEGLALGGHLESLRGSCAEGHRAAHAARCLNLSIGWLVARLEARALPGSTLLRIEGS